MQVNGRKGMGEIRDGAEHDASFSHDVYQCSAWLRNL